MRFHNMNTSMHYIKELELIVWIELKTNIETKKFSRECLAHFIN